ncbi:MAG: polysaccharide deacetylase [Clostridia bacterium]|jgi:peptidoglycan/xylan/chitin deacetylase (PgdA/CDA1 family)|nr:polysaccharide deacetylase [Clostridia bacterium]
MVVEELLAKRREKKKRYKRIQRWRKLVFLAVFLLTFLVFPSFINMETMGGSMEILENADTYEDEVSLNIDEKVGMPDDQQNVQEANNEADQQENHETNHAAVPETNQEEKIVYLTFDDGPTDSLTNILDILAEYDVQATFFMLEPLMSCHVNTLSRMKDEGHAFGLHGVSHDRNLFYASEESVLWEMKTAQAKLLEIIGLNTVLIRVPYGSNPGMTPAYKEAVKAAGFKMWDWNVDSKDWLYRDERFVDYTIMQIEALEKKKTAPVILLHDRKETVAFLPQLLEYLRSNNYLFKVLTAEMEPVQLR